ncbi:TraG family conjugative transposon ATPase [Zhouia spongiae]|uniref:TraG family conjugative transposon ATPase n=1 Tax=Zhouia spongiae TaxID=2202721 RepID=A0ABY3YKI6_9FLAO|nr:TraG family conjugative transposon ATPase [Zhouia spongiae]UNY98332.1 TraG family conjugative transposon ATPase [Zhouia spongiae]
MRINLNAYHPIAHIEDNLVYGSNGNLALGFTLSLPEVYSLSKDDFSKLHQQWFQAFKSLPPRCIIHKQDLYLIKKYNPQNLPQTSFLAKATCDYFQGRTHMVHQSYLFFVWSANKALNASKYRNPFRKVEPSIPLHLEESAKKFKQVVRDTVSFINSNGKVKLHPLSKEQVTAHCKDYFNGYNSDVDTDIELSAANLQIGDHLFDILAINNERLFGETIQPSVVNDFFSSDDFVFHQGFIDGLGLDLKANHIVNQIICLDDKHRWRTLLEKREEELKKSVNFGSQNKLILEKIRGILDQINRDDNSRIIRGHLNVVYWHSQLKALKDIGSRVKTSLKALDIKGYYPTGEARKHYYLNSFPCHVSNFRPDDLYVTDLKHALCLWINTTNYRSDTTGVIFNDRQYNLPVLKDVWDERKKRIKARNFAIFAPTGEGKSFLANNILRQYYEQGIRLVIIDLGGSYTKFAKLYPNDHIVIRYQQGKSLGFNPFYKNPEIELSSDILEDLMAFVAQLYIPQGSLSKYQAVALKRILKAYYHQVNNGHSLQGFYNFIESQRESLLSKLEIHSDYFDVSGFLHVMSEYVNKGIYSFLFDHTQDQSYQLEDKRIIIFELDQVKDHKELLSVMLKLIKSAIERTIWRNRTEKGMILFDEFAKQLKFDNVLESVEFYYQAIRKHNGAIGIILQSINQLPQNSTAASILENTQVIYSLRNEKGYDPLQQRLQLSNHDLNQLKSIRNQLSADQKYTEIFIKVGSQSNVYRLEVPPEVYAAYLTDGEENDTIMGLYQKHNSMEKAIKEFINLKKQIT